MPVERLALLTTRSGATTWSVMNPPNRFAGGTPDRGKAGQRVQSAPLTEAHIRLTPMLQCNIKRPGPTHEAGAVVVLRLTLSDASGTLILLAKAVPKANPSRKSSPICAPDDAYRRTYEDGR